MVHAIVAAILGVAGWGLTLLGLVLVLVGAGLGPDRGGIGVTMLGMFALCGSPLPAFVGLGQAVAALRIRGTHLVVAAIGLILSGLQVGVLLGLVTFGLLFFRG
jgi:hypothetical protein